MVRKVRLSTRRDSAQAAGLRLVMLRSVGLTVVLFAGLGSIVVDSAASAAGSSVLDTAADRSWTNFWPNLWAALQAMRATSEGMLLQIRDWIVSGYGRRPLVMIGLAGTLLLPPLMIAGLLLHRRHPIDKTMPEADRMGSGHTASAWVEFNENQRVPMPVGRDFLQIGREEDNDVCLCDTAVHRYHAVIERTHEYGFTITDVGGPEGNGLSINGDRRLCSLLADGDMIELGSSKLKFATAA